MEIIKNNQGSYTIENKAFKEIAQLACLKVDNIEPAKKVNDFVDVTIDENKVMSIIIHIRIKPLQDIHKLCNHIQEEVNENILLMCGVDCKNINIDIQGFISEKKARI